MKQKLPTLTSRHNRMTIPFDKKRLQLFLWIGLAYLLLGLLIDVANAADNLPARLLNNIWRACYIVAVNFIFFEYTLPFIGRRRNIVLKILFFLFLFWIQLMLYGFGLFAWRHIGIQLHLFIALRAFPSILEGVSYVFPFSFFSMFFFGIIRHMYDHNKLKQAAQQLLIEKQRAELNYLKAQTNPHFLFNTLNNIYALARDKSDLAPKSILRLSKILRFMLYETEGEYITIEQELKIIKDYIALEKLRYDDSLRITFKSNIDDLKRPLPPLLLIPLVENAFKHGVSETGNQPFIDIHLSTDHQQLEFMVRNSAEQPSGELAIKENIGLSNLRRQLELLYTEYDLSVQQGTLEFTATLKVNLASHV
ncbi:MAG: histidine kinase [Bacteroidota bacterium]